jgi:hypothetical protein
MKSNGRFRNFILLAWLGACNCASAQVLLVTQEEARASRSATPQLTAKSLPGPGAPKITLQAPNISQAVASPLMVKLRFRATAPAVILPQTFRVLYGFFQLDITSRITASTVVTSSGLEVPEAQLPAGSHTLLVEVQDSAGRRGRSWFRFEVK